MVFFAGVHKLATPEAWAVYVTDWLAPWLVVSPVLFMLINGVLEVGFGLAIVWDRWTAFAAGVAAVSLSATVGYLALVALLSGGVYSNPVGNCFYSVRTAVADSEPGGSNVLY